MKCEDIEFQVENKFYPWISNQIIINKKIHLINDQLMLDQLINYKMVQDQLFNDQLVQDQLMSVECRV